MWLDEQGICRAIDRDPALRSELASVAQSRLGWTSNRSTERLVRELSLAETARRIARRQASLLFNGKVLHWEEHGNSRAWPATSGKRGYSTPENQSERDVGPIPEGRYLTSQGEFQRWDDIGLVEKLLAIAKRGPFPGGTIAWGYHRVWLKPQAGTNTFGRSGFSIHGGLEAGSIGCIDLTSSMPAFVHEFILYAKDMILEVRY
jgi:hypothetical protein